MPCCSYRFISTFILLGVAAAVSAGTGLQAAEAQDKPTFAVSYVDLGAVDQLQAKGTELVDELNDRAWCTARAVPPGTTWHDPPSGIDPNEWLSVVTVGFHEQAEAYVFRFDGRTGSARLLAHTPHRKRFSRGVKIWTSPYVRLLSGLRVNYSRGDSSLPRPVVRLEFVETPMKPSVGPSNGAIPALDEPLTLEPAKVRPPLEAIITAAACEAGFAPTFAAAKDSLRVEIGVRDRACSFRITSTIAGKSATVVKDRVPWEEYHAQLVRLFQQVSGPTPVRDFVRLDTGNTRLLAAADQRLVCLVDDELTALDAATAAEAWRIRIPQSKVPGAAKKVERYAVRFSTAGKPRLIRWTKSLAEYSIADGRETPLAPIAASAETAFDLDDAGRVVIVEPTRLVLFDRQAEVWSVNEKKPLTCGPLLDRDRIFVGNDQGELIAVAIADGKPLWRTSVGGRPVGPITSVGRLRVVFSYDDETLTAIDGTDGSVKWRWAAGDALVQPPLVDGDNLIVATKQNRLVRLTAETGSPTAENVWPTWIDQIELLETGDKRRLSVCDLDGRITLVADDLKPMWQVQLSARRSGIPAVATLPEVWQPQPAKPSGDDILAAIANDAVPVRPFLLSTDVDGFLEKISLPDAK